MYDVAIIGGGVIGLSVAWRLAGEKLKVVILDQGACGQEASWSGVGIQSPCSWHRTDAWSRVHQDSIFKYHQFAAAVQETSGIDPEFRRCGALKLIRDDNRTKMAMNEVAAVGGRLTPEGRPIVTTLTAAVARNLEPHLTEKILGAQYCQLTSQVRNPRLLRGLVKCCEISGVTIIENTQIIGLLKEPSPGGDTTVSGVRTINGHIQANKVILCAGAWSSLLDETLARYVPVYPVRGQILLLQPAQKPFERIIEEGNFYMVARDDGLVLVGSTEEHESGFNKRNTASGLSYLSRQAIEFVPVLKQATLVRSWSGLRPGTPDRRPIVGWIPEHKNLLACTGHFRTGLTTAPVVTNIVADLLVKGSCTYDLARVSPARTYKRVELPARLL